MKVRRHILKRFNELSKKRQLISIECDLKTGSYFCQFESKITLVLNEIEHDLILKTRGEHDTSRATKSN